MIDQQFTAEYTESAVLSQDMIHLKGMIHVYSNQYDF